MKIISIIKPTRCTNVSKLFYFGITLHVSDGLSVHHHEFTTVHTATGMCQTDNRGNEMYSRELTTEGKTVRNMQSYSKIK